MGNLDSSISLHAKYYLSLGIQLVLRIACTCLKKNIFVSQYAHFAIAILPLVPYVTTTLTKKELLEVVQG